jgi:hypothetical protein
MLKNKEVAKIIFSQPLFTNRYNQFINTTLMLRKNINSDCLRYDTNTGQNIAGPNVSSNITSIDTQKIGNPSAVVKMKIPSKVVFIHGDAFQDFVNLQEAEIDGEVYKVSEYYTPNGGVQAMVDYKNPVKLATALKGGRAIHIKREYDWK